MVKYQLRARKPPRDWINYLSLYSTLMVRLITRRYWRLIVLAAVVAFAGVLRLNSLQMFTPDSSGYLAGARALVTLHGYVQLDHPESPPVTLRPPGLCLLLMPIALFLPYNVVAAKLLIIASGLVLGCFVYLFVRQSCGEERQGEVSGLLAAAIVALSPYTLMYSTEVLSEVPYAAACVVAIYLLAKPPGPVRARRLIGLALLMSLVILCRSAGIAFVVAVGLWSLCSRSRRPHLFSVVPALVVFCLWSLRSDMLGGAGYSQVIRGQLAGQGVLGMLLRTLRSAHHELYQLLELMLPGLLPGHPGYWQPISSGAAPPPAIHPLFVGLGILALGLSLVGMVARRHQGGFLAAVYFLLYLGCVSIWPWKDERFVWPLLPVVWMFVPAGVLWVTSIIVSGGKPVRRRVLGAAGMAVALLVLWQCSICARMVHSNMKYLLSADQFYADESPQFYYCDWGSAGHWIRHNTPPHARLLSRHADVGLAARRFQISHMWESVTPVELHGKIAEFGATHLVLPDPVFTEAFDWQLVESDLVYQFVPVYQARHVLVVQIQPNRSATYAPGNNLLHSARSQVKESALRFPRRFDLQHRMALLLHDEDRTEAAIELLEQVVSTGIRDAAIDQTRGWLFLTAGRNREATAAFRRALSLPGGLGRSASIHRGLQLAGARLDAQQNKPDRVSLEWLLHSARSNMDRFRTEIARRRLEQAESVDPDSPQLWLLQAELLARTGDAEAAEVLLDKIDGDEADARLRIIRASRALAGTTPVDFRNGEKDYHMDPDEPADHLRLAMWYAEQGLPGAALAVMENATIRFPASVPALLERARWEVHFSLLDEAATTYERVLELDDGRQEAIDQLHIIEQRRREPEL